MTGGVGFSRDGNNTLKRNRDILNPRKRNAQNPYWANNKVTRKVAGNFSELVRWKTHRVLLIKKRRVVIFAMVGIIVILLMAYFLIL